MFQPKICKLLDHILTSISLKLAFLVHLDDFRAFHAVNIQPGAKMTTVCAHLCLSAARRINRSSPAFISGLFL